MEEIIFIVSQNAKRYNVKTSNKKINYRSKSKAIEVKVIYFESIGSVGISKTDCGKKCKNDAECDE